MGRENHPITDEPDKDKHRRNPKFTGKLEQSTICPPFYYTFRNKEKPFPIALRTRTRDKISNLKNAISADSKELSVYVTHNSVGENTHHLVMLKKKTNDPKYRRGMTLTRNKKPSNAVSNGKHFEYPFTFFEKVQTKSSLENKFNKKPQIAVSGTRHTVTTDKNKILHRKLISNPIPFQATATPTKRINTRLTITTDKPSCSKTTETTCGYRRKKPPRPENTESSSNWLKRKDQPRIKRGRFTGRDKLAGKPMDLELSMVSEDDFQCYNTSEGKPVHISLNDEL